jgi:hypothetical protein
LEKVENFRQPESPRKTPQLTTNPPQIHHDLPSKKHPKSPKTPAKLPFRLSKFFLPSETAKLSET